MILLPEGLKALKKVAKQVGLDLKGAYLNLDAGFDSTANRTCLTFPIRDFSERSCTFPANTP
jgi:hypothetical protein